MDPVFADSSNESKFRVWQNKTGQRSRQRSNGCPHSKWTSCKEYRYPFIWLKSYLRCGTYRFPLEEPGIQNPRRTICPKSNLKARIHFHNWISFFQLNFFFFRYSTTGSVRWNCFGLTSSLIEMILIQIYNDCLCKRMWPFHVCEKQMRRKNKQNVIANTSNFSHIPLQLPHVQKSFLFR